jgi:hypothetical protein
MSQLEGIARSIAWACGFTALGLTAGVLVDGVLGQRLSTISKNPGVKAFVQLAIGLGVLAEAVAVIIPAETIAPISDGLMFYWFFQGQPHLSENMKALRLQISKSLFPQPSSVVPGGGLPPADAPVVSPQGATKPPSDADKLRDIMAGMVDPFDPTRPPAGYY